MPCAYSFDVMVPMPASAVISAARRITTGW